MNERASVRGLAVTIVDKTMRNGIYADELLASTISAQGQLTAQDKSLLTELVHGTLRWLGQIDWILQQHLHGDLKDLPPQLKSILRVSLYQLRFLERVPSYAAVNEGVRLAKSIGGKGWGNLANAVLRAYLRSPNPAEKKAKTRTPVQQISVDYSHPEWLIERWLDRYGVAQTEALCSSNNKRPQITVRPNCLKISTADLCEQLLAAGFDAEITSQFGEFILIKNAGGLTDTGAFEDGLFTIQDPSTAISCYLLDPGPGETVVDLCAAPGGKTVIMAQLMQDEGLLLACDRSATRLQMLRENTRRLRLNCVRIAVADGEILALKRVDRVLLDAPCSGLGVLSRRSDLRWKRTMKDIIEIAGIQASLLQRAADLLRPGGTLVYSTCTIEPEENEAIVDKFLTKNPHFALDRECRLPLGAKNICKDGYWGTLPHIHNVDGVFAARLIKQMDKN